MDDDQTKTATDVLEWFRGSILGGREGLATDHLVPIGELPMY